MNEIKEYFEKHDYIYVPIDSEKSIKIVYDLVINNIVSENLNDIEALYYGSFYRINKEYELAEHYYKLSIDKGNVVGISNLATLYYTLEKYDLAKKYYKMAINKGRDSVLGDLANSYYHLKKYDKSEKYYLMAIDKGRNNVLGDLANSYYHLKKYDKSEKYYLMAIDKGNNVAIKHLVRQYIRTKKYDVIEKYITMLLEKNIKLPTNVKKYYNDTRDQSFLKLLINYKDNSLYDLLLIFDCDILKKEYYNAFCTIEIPDKFENVKMKQYILKKTGIWPKYYSQIRMIEFTELLSLKTDLPHKGYLRLPKDIILHIAGCLFI